MTRGTRGKTILFPPFFPKGFSTGLSAFSFVAGGVAFPLAPSWIFLNFCCLDAQLSLLNFLNPERAMTGLRVMAMGDAGGGRMRGHEATGDANQVETSQRRRHRDIVDCGYHTNEREVMNNTALCTPHSLNYRSELFQGGPQKPQRKWGVPQETEQTRDLSNEQLLQQQKQKIEGDRNNKETTELL